MVGVTAWKFLLKNTDKTNYITKNIILLLILVFVGGGELGTEVGFFLGGGPVLVTLFLPFPTFLGNKFRYPIKLTHFINIIKVKRNQKQKHFDFLTINNILFEIFRPGQMSPLPLPRSRSRTNPACWPFVITVEPT